MKTHDNFISNNFFFFFKENTYKKCLVKFKDDYLWSINSVGWTTSSPSLVPLNQRSRISPVSRFQFFFPSYLFTLSSLLYIIVKIYSERWYIPVRWWHSIKGPPHALYGQTHSSDFSFVFLFCSTYIRTHFSTGMFERGKDKRISDKRYKNLGTGTDGSVTYDVNCRTLRVDRKKEKKKGIKNRLLNRVEIPIRL